MTMNFFIFKSVMKFVNKQELQKLKTTLFFHKLSLFSLSKITVY